MLIYFYHYFFYVWNYATQRFGIGIFVNNINTYHLQRYGPYAKLSIVSWMLHVLNIQWWHLVYIYIYI